MPRHDETPHWPQDLLRTAFSAAQLSPETRARHLHTLRHRAASLAEHASAPSRAGRSPRRGGLRLRLAAVATSALLALGGGAGAAVASTEALPGDGLYPVKLAVEEVRQRLSADQETAVRRGLERAELRLTEVAALQQQRRDEHIAAALARHDDHIAGAEQLAAGDADLEAAVTEARTRAAERLAELLAKDLPEEASDRAREALQTNLDRFEEQGEQGPASLPAPARTRRAPAQPGPPEHTQQGQQGGDADPPGRTGTRADDVRRDAEHHPGQANDSSPDARPGGGTPPPPPGSRAPRGPRAAP